MREVALTKSDSELAVLVDEVASSGEGVLITRDGAPAARLIAVAPKPSAQDLSALGAYLAAHRRELAAACVGRPSMTWEELKAEMDEDW